jgi:hypothetical protein
MAGWVGFAATGRAANPAITVSALLSRDYERALVSLMNFFTKPSTALSSRLSGFFMSIVFTS